MLLLVGRQTSQSASRTSNNQRGQIASNQNRHLVPEPDVVIASFRPAGPVLAVRPYTSNDAYWQVYFDTMAIREVLGDGSFPAPMPVYGIQQLSALAARE